MLEGERVTGGEAGERANHRSWPCPCPADSMFIGEPASGPGCMVRRPPSQRVACDEAEEDVTARRLDAGRGRDASGIKRHSEFSNTSRGHCPNRYPRALAGCRHSGVLSLGLRGAGGQAIPRLLSMDGLTTSRGACRAKGVGRHVFSTCPLFRRSVCCPENRASETRFSSRVSADPSPGPLSRWHNRDTPCTSPGVDIRASCLWGSETHAVRPPLVLYFETR